MTKQEAAMFTDSIVESVKTTDGVFVNGEIKYSRGSYADYDAYIDIDSRDQFDKINDTIELDTETAIKNAESINAQYQMLKAIKDNVEKQMAVLQGNAWFNIRHIKSCFGGNMMADIYGYVLEAIGTKRIPCYCRGGSKEDCVEFLKYLDENFFKYLDHRVYLGIPKDVGGDHTFRYIEFWLEGCHHGFELQIPTNDCACHTPLNRLGATTTIREMYQVPRVLISSSARMLCGSDWSLGNSFKEVAEKLNSMLKDETLRCNKIPEGWESDKWNISLKKKWEQIEEEWADVFVFWYGLAKENDIKGIVPYETAVKEPPVNE